MDAGAALSELGLRPGASWDEIRSAYRRRIRVVHPDVAPLTVGATEATSRLTEAYRVLRRHHAPPPTPDKEPAPAEKDGEKDSEKDGAGPWLAVRHELDLGGYDTFDFLLAAAHRIGSVSHVDPEEGLLQVIVESASGPRCQLLVTIDRSTDPELVAFTLDSLTHAPAPPIDDIVEALLGPACIKRGPS